MVGISQSKNTSIKYKWTGASGKFVSIKHNYTDNNMWNKNNKLLDW